MRSNRHGFSLVELLVVIGILGILAGIAIPATRMFMNSDPTSHGARILFQVFKAAKVYAGTNNTRCAVVFNIREVKDSLTGETVHVFDAVMIAREVKRRELIEAEIPLPIQRAGQSPIFVPIKNFTGVWTFLPKDTCVLGEGFTFGTKFLDVHPITGQQLFDVNGNLVPFEVPDLISDTGIFAIRVIDGNWPSLMEPTGIFEENDLMEIFDGHLPAYVYNTDGTLDVSESFTKQRVVLSIGLLPNAEIEERFLIDPDTGEPELEEIEGEEEPGDPIQLVTTLTLYHSTGRIKVGD